MRRFRGTIRKQGPSACVDVPEAVSRAFARFARAGRIRFDGTLDGAPIRGTLIPAGRGRHRLFVNGGMRSAAGVAVGDTASFALRPAHPETIRLPADVARALRRASSAKAALDALPPSHRREILRYIDDARSPETRRRRIEKSIAHVLGRQQPSGERRPGRPLWTCPRCGNQFVNPNQYHSCQRHDLAEPFAGKAPVIRELFDRLRAMAEACGPVRLVAYRDRVAFMVRVRFAGAVPRSRWLDVEFWLPRRIEHPRFRRVETLYPNAHIHSLRISEVGQLDAQVAAWLGEAYSVGCQEHLAPSRTSARVRV